MQALKFCPNCSFHFDENNVGWTCLQILRTPKENQGSAEDLDEVFEGVDKNSDIDILGTFGDDEICETFNESGAKSCSTCEKKRQETESRDSCPECKMMLPYVENISDISGSFTITGVSGAGKTTFLVSLHQWWRKYLGRFNFSFSPAMDDRLAKYFDRIRRRLIRGKKAAVATTRGRRISFTWVLSALEEDSSVICTLPEVAGEELTEFRSLLRNRHYDNCRGIILLLDGVRIARDEFEDEDFEDEDWDEEQDEARDPEDHEKLVRAMIEYFNQKKIDTSDIPLAICVNKVDVLRDIGWDPLIANYDTNHPELHMFDYAGCDRRSNEVRNRLYKDDNASSFLPTLEDKFDNVMYFPMATLGTADENKIKPRPIGVEAPFLWLLWHHGMIPGTGATPAAY